MMSNVQDVFAEAAPLEDRKRIAQRLVSLGFWLFPCERNGKRPAFDGWQALGTRDLVQIDGWIDDGLNIAIDHGHFGEDGALKLLSVDLDTHGGKDGISEWRKLTAEHGDIPPTYEQNTPSGGRHLVYVAPTDIANSAGRLARGVDVRGSHGYIVAAGSIIDGKEYEIAHSTAPALAPEWLLAFCQRAKSAASIKRKVSTVPAGTDDAIKDVRAYLATADAAIEFDGSDHHTVKIAARCKDLGASEAQTLALMLEPGGWNSRNLPHPFDPEWLAEKIHNAFKYGQNEPGSALPSFKPVVAEQADSDGIRLASLLSLKAPEPLAQSALNDGAQSDTAQSLGRWALDRIALGKMTLQQALDRLRDGTHPLQKLRQLVRLSDVALRDGPIWLIRDWLPVRSIAMMYGASSAGKTAIGVDMAMSLADGSDWQGQYPLAQGPVLYAALENADDTERRFLAAREKRKLADRDDIALYIYRDGANLASDNPADTQKLIDQCNAISELHGQPVSLVVIDTLAYATPGADENSAKDMGKFLARCNEIRSQTGAAVLFIHHPGKDESRKARGSYAIFAGVDTELTVEDGSITVTKQRSGATGVKARFSLEFPEIGTQTIGDTTAPITGVTVAWEGQPSFTPVKPNATSGDDAKAIRLTGNPRRLLTVIEDLSRGGLAPTEEQAQAEFGAKHYPDGKPRRIGEAYRRALGKLYAKKLITGEADGKGQIGLRFKSGGLFPGGEDRL